jgi:hypothetical protein
VGPLPDFCIAMQSGHIRSSASRQLRQNVRPQNEQRSVAGAPQRWQVPTSIPKAPYRTEPGTMPLRLRASQNPSAYGFRLT